MCPSPGGPTILKSSHGGLVLCTVDSSQRAQKLTFGTWNVTSLWKKEPEPLQEVEQYQLGCINHLLEGAWILCYAGLRCDLPLWVCFTYIVATVLHLARLPCYPWEGYFPAPLGQACSRPLTVIGANRISWPSWSLGAAGRRPDWGRDFNAKRGNGSDVIGWNSIVFCLTCVLVTLWLNLRKLKSQTCLRH